MDCLFIKNTAESTDPKLSAQKKYPKYPWEWVFPRGKTISTSESSLCKAAIQLHPEG